MNLAENSFKNKDVLPGRLAVASVEKSAARAGHGRRGIALFIVLALALTASIAFFYLFRLMQQSASMSRSLAQRITASAWNDRILARIAAVVAANNWERRFFRLGKEADDPYFFDVATFPFVDMAEDCDDELVNFEGAIMDVPGEQRYRVKLNLRCGSPPVTYSTFTEARFAPNLLDMANRGVVQTIINLGPDDIGLTVADFARSISRSSGLKKDVETSSTQLSDQMNYALGIDEGDVIENHGDINFNPKSVLTVPEEFGGIYNFVETIDDDYLSNYINTFCAVCKASKDYPTSVYDINLPGMNANLKTIKPEEHQFMPFHWVHTPIEWIQEDIAQYNEYLKDDPVQFLDFLLIYTQIPENARLAKMLEQDGEIDARVALDSYLLALFLFAQDYTVYERTITKDLADEMKKLGYTNCPEPVSQADYEEGISFFGPMRCYFRDNVDPAIAERTLGNAGDDYDDYFGQK